MPCGGQIPHCRLVTGLFCLLGENECSPNRLRIKYLLIYLLKKKKKKICNFPILPKDQTHIISSETST